MYGANMYIEKLHRETTSSINSNSDYYMRVVVWIIAVYHLDIALNTIEYAMANYTIFFFFYSFQFRHSANDEEKRRKREWDCCNTGYILKCHPFNHILSHCPFGVRWLNTYFTFLYYESSDASRHRIESYTIRLRYRKCFFDLIKARSWQWCRCMLRKTGLFSCLFNSIASGIENIGRVKTVHIYLIPFRLVINLCIKM